MDNAARAAIVLIFLSFWSMFFGLGQILAARCEFLSAESAIISTRGVLVAKGEPASLVNLPLAHPPLPYFLVVPFAHLGIPFPSIAVSSMFGAAIAAWTLVHFRERIARHPQLALVALAVPLQPGIFHSAVTGSANVTALALLGIATYTVCRFTLEQQTFDDLRTEGRMTAWLASETYQSRRVSFLWTSALFLGLATLGRFDLVFALPIFLVATPFLLPAHERTNLPKLATLVLVLYMPVFAVHVMWAYLCWVFTGDFLHGLKNPSSYFLQTSLTPNAPTTDAMGVVGSTLHVLGGVLVSSPLLVAVIARLRNPAVALTCLAPFVVEIGAESLWKVAPSRDFFSLAGLQCGILVFLGVGLGRFRRWERIALPIAMVASTLTAWWFFLESPLREERVWKSLARGELDAVRTFPEERKLIGILASRPDLKRILMDEEIGYPLIALMNDPSRFLLSYQQGFATRADNPHVTSDAMLFSTARTRRDQTDEVALKWTFLESDRRSFFGESASVGRWTLLENQQPPP